MAALASGQWSPQPTPATLAQKALQQQARQQRKAKAKMQEADRAERAGVWAEGSDGEEKVANAYVATNFFDAPARIGGSLPSWACREVYQGQFGFQRAPS